VENECTSHNFSLFAIFLPKIVKIGGNLTNFWQKQFCTVFLDTVYKFSEVTVDLTKNTQPNAIQNHPV